MSRVPSFVRILSYTLPSGDWYVADGPLCVDLSQFNGVIETLSHFERGDGSLFSLLMNHLKLCKCGEKSDVEIKCICDKSDWPIFPMYRVLSFDGKVTEYVIHPDHRQIAIDYFSPKPDSTSALIDTIGELIELIAYNPTLGAPATKKARNHFEQNIN